MCVFSGQTPIKVHKLPKSKGIKAYKRFNIGYPDMLSSLVQHTDWPKSGYMKAHRIDKPDNCGIYALRLSVPMRDAYASVQAEVLLYGTVYEYKDGYRAEKCQIIKVRVLAGIRRTLSYLYGGDRFAPLLKRYKKIEFVDGRGRPLERSVQ